MQRKYQVLVGTVLLVSCYAVVAVSPIQEAIGRRRPDLAGLFSPPFFNFSATYTEGYVLGFRIGMSTPELFQQIGHTFVDVGQIVRGCVVETGESLIPIHTTTDVESIYGEANRLCIFAPGASGGRMIVTFTFEADTVSSVQIRYVRTEGF